MFATARGQNQAANWYFFNNSGIRFDWCSDSVNNNTDIAIDNEAVQNAAFERDPAVISDKYGNLLLYTNGLTIWDRLHQPLPNANQIAGTGLGSDVYLNYNSLILPKPNDTDLYYVFTINTTGWFYTSTPSQESPGLVYSIVDMNLNNGLGDIIPSRKNIPLTTQNSFDAGEAYFKIDSKITAVRGDDCSSYWIITRFKSSFYVFKLDENGIDSNPVVTNAIPVIDVFYQNNLTAYHGLGELKASPDGSKIAHITRSVYDEDTFLKPGGIYLYDFDKSTGIISNPKTIFIGQNEDEYPGSAEFSASSNWLYAFVSDNLQLDGDEKSTLWRWNLNSANISATQELVFEEIDRYSYNSIQLGLDRKIYHSKFSLEPPLDIELATYLGIMNNPEAGNAAGINYDPNGFLIRENEFSPSRISGNLPQLNAQWFNQNIDIIRNGLSKCELFLCNGESEFLTGIPIDGANYIWLKDGTIIPNETDRILEVTDPGFYELIIEPNDGSCPIEGRAEVKNSNEFAVAIDTVIEQCDEDDVSDGLTVFNLNNFTQTITNNNADMIVQFYLSLEDIENQGFGINGLAYTNTSNPETLYALVTNSLSGCQDIAEITLRVTKTDVNDMALDVCDEDDLNDGISTFNLNQFVPDITNGLPSGLQVIFYETYDDALLENFPLVTPYTNTTPYKQTIYARVENNNNCYGISEIELEILAPPNVESNDTEYYCLNSFPEPILINSGLDANEIDDFKFEWSTGETTESISVFEVGTYTVNIINSAGCATLRTIEVLASNIANIINIDVIDISNNNSITIFVSGEGDYEYALNDPDGPYQDSNQFNQLSPGFYTIYVRDKNNCGITDELVSVLGFPKFFTPNSDGINDLWQISGLNSDIQIAEPILIFNRYGKLLIELSPESNGWDGTYNGNKMPSSDYWFSVKFTDGRQFKGNFALKR